MLLDTLARVLGVGDLQVGRCGPFSSLLDTFETVPQGRSRAVPRPPACAAGSGSRCRHAADPFRVMLRFGVGFRALAGLVGGGGIALLRPGTFSAGFFGAAPYEELAAGVGICLVFDVALFAASHIGLIWSWP